MTLRRIDVAKRQRLVPSVCLHTNRSPEHKVSQAVGRDPPQCEPNRPVLKNSFQRSDIKKILFLGK
jgi:hypothetical protein